MTQETEWVPEEKDHCKKYSPSTYPFLMGDKVKSVALFNSFNTFVCLMGSLEYAIFQDTSNDYVVAINYCDFDITEEKIKEWKEKQDDR